MKNSPDLLKSIWKMPIFGYRIEIPLREGIPKMGEGLERFKQLLAQGYGITKSKETPEGLVKCIVTHTSTGMKKVVDLTKEEYNLALKMS